MHILLELQRAAHNSIVQAHTTILNRESGGELPLKEGPGGLQSQNGKQYNQNHLSFPAAWKLELAKGLEPPTL